MGSDLMWTHTHTITWVACSVPCRIGDMAETLLRSTLHADVAAHLSMHCVAGPATVCASMPGPKLRVAANKEQHQMAEMPSKRPFEYEYHIPHTSMTTLALIWLLKLSESCTSVLVLKVMTRCKTHRASEGVPPQRQECHVCPAAPGGRQGA